MAAPDLTPGIATSAGAPAAVIADGLQVTAQPIAAQIAADRYVAAKAGRAQRRRGLMFTKVVPAGAMSDSQGTRLGGGNFGGGAC